MNQTRLVRSRPVAGLLVLGKGSVPSTVTVGHGVPGSLVGLQGQSTVERSARGVPMLAQELASEVPTVHLDTRAVEAARLVVDQHLPGIIVVDDDRRPVAVLAATALLRLLVPAYTLENPAVARTVNERYVDEFLSEAGDRRVRECLGDQPRELPQIRANATVLELAAMMVRNRCPLVVVVDRTGGVLGAVTLDALLARMLA